jgi:predicted aspartyl protease
VNHAIGRIHLADEYASRALEINPDNIRALHARAMLDLYLARYNAARLSLERIIELGADPARSFLMFQTAHEIYSACRDMDALAQIHEERAAYLESIGEIAAAGNKHRDAKFYREIAEREFYSCGAVDDRIEIPLVDYPAGTPYKCAVMVIDGKEYYVLIDTGNSVGWTVHGNELRRKLVSIRGANVAPQSGVTRRALTGHNIITDSIALGGIKLRNLLGVYFPKPRGGSFDATLNPFFIRDRVVTIDFVNDLLILRTKERFDSDIAELPAESISRLPCYGYRWLYVPAIVNGADSALALIETGAQGVSLRLEFAELIGFPFIERRVTATSGEIRTYHEASVEIKLGSHKFIRRSAKVWPVRFRDEITGMCDDVMIGAYALQNRYVISYDSVKREVIVHWVEKRIEP